MSAREIYDRVIGRVKNGSIVLFHNAAKHTPEALPMILEKLQADGYKIIKINDMIYKNDYYMDVSGMQIPVKKEATEVE